MSDSLFDFFIFITSLVQFGPFELSVPFPIGQRDDCTGRFVFTALPKKCYISNWDMYVLKAKLMSSTVISEFEFFLQYLLKKMQR